MTTPRAFATLSPGLRVSALPWVIDKRNRNPERVIELRRRLLNSRTLSEFTEGQVFLFPGRCRGLEIANACGVYERVANNKYVIAGRL